jgi:L-alanine-DL-glutamate epimerase-like enolase superfamily enzyme
MPLPLVCLGSVRASPLEVPLVEPFVIACGTVTTTRNALVRIDVMDGATGPSATGLGEAATLVPVTAEDLPDVLATLDAAGEDLEGMALPLDDGFRRLTEALDELAERTPVARSALETALLDGAARLAGLPLRVLLGGERGAATPAMTTDITIPIRDVATMAALARAHRAQGFTCFKVKVGRDVEHDFEAIAAIAAAVPDARFRIDANAGFTAREAISLMNRLGAAGLKIECFEQPCATDDLAGMAEVAAAIDPPVIADESVKRVADVARLVAARAADGVNLKIAKSGGPLAALAIGRAAQAAGLRVMCGGMVETRLGMTAAAHVVAALGGVDFVDLDTAWLLAEDPFEGGYAASGPDYVLDGRPGLGVSVR